MLALLVLLVVVGVLASRPGPRGTLRAVAWFTFLWAVAALLLSIASLTWRLPEAVVVVTNLLAASLAAAVLVVYALQEFLPRRDDGSARADDDSRASPSPSDPDAESSPTPR